MRKFIILLSCLFFLVGCSKTSNNSSDKEKLTSEVEFYSLKIMSLLNDLNNISLENYELLSEKVNISKESEGNNSGSQSSQSSSSSQSGGGNQGEASQSGNQNSQSKGNTEISVTDMQKKSILKSNNEEIDWDNITSEIELMNTSWSITMLDLTNANVSNDDILTFANTLNQTIIGVKNEDKATTLSNLTSLYSYVPKFLTAISADKHVQSIENTKYYVLACYTSISEDDWVTASTNISSAENSFLSILNDTEYSKNREYKINKTYMLIKDMQNALTNKDKELSFLKYKNLLESLNTL